MSTEAFGITFPKQVVSFKVADRAIICVIRSMIAPGQHNRQIAVVVGRSYSFYRFHRFGRYCVGHDFIMFCDL